MSWTTHGISFHHALGSLHSRRVGCAWRHRCVMDVGMQGLWWMHKLFKVCMWSVCINTMYWYVYDISIYFSYYVRYHPARGPNTMQFTSPRTRVAPPNYENESSRRCDRASINQSCGYKFTECVWSINLPLEFDQVKIIPSGFINNGTPERAIYIYKWYPPILWHTKKPMVVVGTALVTNHD